MDREKEKKGAIKNSRLVLLLLRLECVGTEEAVVRFPVIVDCPFNPANVPFVESLSFCATFPNSRTKRLKKGENERNRQT